MLTALFKKCVYPTSFDQYSINNLSKLEDISQIEETLKKVKQCQKTYFPTIADWYFRIIDCFNGRKERNYSVLNEANTYLVARIKIANCQDKQLKEKVEKYLTITTKNSYNLGDRGNKDSVHLSMDEANKLFELINGDFSIVVKHMTLNTGRNTELPSGFAKLSNLELLSFKPSTRLTTLPNWIEKHPKLQYLDLGLNRLTIQPDSLSTLPNLQWLFIDKNNQISVSLRKSTKIKIFNTQSRQEI